MEVINIEHSNSKLMKKLVFGSLVLASGILLLGFNVGLLDDSFRSIVFSWPMLLIAIGIVNIAGRESLMPGVILMGVGATFLVPRLFNFNFDFRTYLFPVLLIAFGLMIMIKRAINPRRKFREHFEKHGRRGHSRFSDSNNNTLAGGYIDHSYVFNGGEFIIDAPEFKGGRISTVFGGAQIDFTRTTLAEGTNVLEIDCVFGGVNLIVPADWVVHVQIDSVMGGFADKRRSNDAVRDHSRELLIKGSTVFGGGEIRSY